MSLSKFTTIGLVFLVCLAGCSHFQKGKKSKRPAHRSEVGECASGTCASTAVGSKGEVVHTVCIASSNREAPEDLRGECANLVCADKNWKECEYDGNEAAYQWFEEERSKVWKKLFSRATHYKTPCLKGDIRSCDYFLQPGEHASRVATICKSKKFRCVEFARTSNLPEADRQGRDSCSLGPKEILCQWSAKNGAIQYTKIAPRN